MSGRHSHVCPRRRSSTIFEFSLVATIRLKSGSPIDRNHFEFYLFSVYPDQNVIRRFYGNDPLRRLTLSHHRIGQKEQRAPKKQHYDSTSPCVHPCCSTEKKDQSRERRRRVIGRVRTI
jgi:hypothetical protein